MHTASHCSCTYTSSLHLCFRSWCNLVLIFSQLWGANNAQKICTVNDHDTYMGLTLLGNVHVLVYLTVSLKLLTTDLLMQAISQLPGNYLPMCVVTQDYFQVQQLNCNGTVNINLMILFGLDDEHFHARKPLLLYICDNSLTQVGNVTV